MACYFWKDENIVAIEKSQKRMFNKTLIIFIVFVFPNTCFLGCVKMFDQVTYDVSIVWRARNDTAVAVLNVIEWGSLGLALLRLLDEGTISLR